MRLPAAATSVFVAAVFTLAFAQAAPVDRTLYSAPLREGTPGGPRPEGSGSDPRWVLANEPDAKPTTLRLEFDLSGFVGLNTPMARLVLRDVEKIKVARPGQTAGSERAAFHVFDLDGPSPDAPVAANPVQPASLPYSYTFDVTDSVRRALAAHARTLRLLIRPAGKPLPFEVYGVSREKIALELAPLDGWSDDFAERIAPITQGATVYREACLPITQDRTQEVVLSLIYPARRVVEVIRNATGEKLQEGSDWVLRDGRVVLPAGTRAPVQLASEFFQAPRKNPDGTTTLAPTQIRLTEGSFYHECQIEITYEPASRDTVLPSPRSTLADLPRFQRRLASRAPVTVILFGDSISAGYNSSRHSGVWPYQPSFGSLVARRLATVGGPVTFLNHSRGGETSLHAMELADAQVGWFKPDLVIIGLGMNDRSAARLPAHGANMDKIIATIHARSPETEFLVVTPMLNNPKQPAGLDPVKSIRDQALALARPGVAFVDLTTTQLELLKRKPYLDFSGNGANHPNDFLIRLYAQRILEVLTPTVP